MIGGRITIDSFSAEVHNGEKTALDEKGNPTGEKKPIKILILKDKHSGLAIDFVFTPEGLDLFGDQIVKASSKVIRPPADPLGNFKSLFGGNGRIRG